MTPGDVITIFERRNTEGRPDVPPDETVAGFAGWLAESWNRLDEDDEIVLLTSVGTALWRGSRSVSSARTTKSVRR